MYRVIFDSDGYYDFLKEKNHSKNLLYARKLELYNDFFINFYYDPSKDDNIDIDKIFKMTSIIILSKDNKEMYNRVLKENAIMIDNIYLNGKRIAEVRMSRNKSNQEFLYFIETEEGVIIQ